MRTYEIRNGKIPFKAIATLLYDLSDYQVFLTADKTTVYLGKYREKKGDVWLGTRRKDYDEKNKSFIHEISYKLETLLREELNKGEENES